MSQAIEVRASLHGAELRIVAIRIDNDRVVDSASLRSIRMGALTDELHAYVTEELAAAEDEERELGRAVERLEAADERGTRRGFTSAPPEMLSGLEQAVLTFAEAGVYRQALTNALANDGAGEFRPRGRGSKPPTDDEYRQFAAIYLEELSTRPRGAKKRTADRAAMDRGTAYRWIRECQRRGLIPDDSKDDRNG